MINLNEGIALTQTTINQIDTTNTNVVNNQTTVNGLTNEVDREFHHETVLFPEGSNETYIMSAGSTNNVFGDWAEVADNVLNKLSDKCEGEFNLHITGLVLEDASVKDKIYVCEIAYGDNKTMVSRGRFMAGNAKEGVTQAVKVKAEHIPCSELIYTRLKCETASATLQVHIRYHFDTVSE